MPDLSQLSHEVQGLPDQALQQELQQPSGLVPNYLVLAEAQRRQLMRQAQEKQQSQGQSSSVYDDVVRDMMARQPPQGLPAAPAGMTPIGNATPQTPGATPPQNFAQPQAKPPGMAKGGAVHYQFGGGAAETAFGSDPLDYEPERTPAPGRRYPDYSDLYDAADQANNLPSGTTRGVIMQESGGNPNAIGPVIPKGRYKGQQAHGIAQFMSDTARDYGVDDPYDPEQAIPAAGRYLGDLIRKYHTPEAALAHYYGIGRHTIGPPTPKYVTQTMARITGTQGVPTAAQVADAAANRIPTAGQVADAAANRIPTSGQVAEAAKGDMSPPEPTGGEDPERFATEPVITGRLFGAQTAEEARDLQNRDEEEAALPPEMQEGSTGNLPEPKTQQVSQTSEAEDPWASSREQLAQMFRQANISKATIRALQAQYLDRAQNVNPWDFLGNISAGMADYARAAPYGTAGLPMMFSHGVGVATQAKNAERQQSLSNYLALENEAEKIDQNMYNLQTAGWTNVMKTGVYGPESDARPGWNFIRDPVTPGYGIWQPKAQPVTKDMIDSGFLTGNNPATGKPWQPGDMLSGQQVFQIQQGQFQSALAVGKKGGYGTPGSVDYYVQMFKDNPTNPEGVMHLVPPNMKMAVSNALAAAGVKVTPMSATERRLYAPQDPAVVDRWVELAHQDSKNFTAIRGDPGLMHAVVEGFAKKGYPMINLDASIRDAAQRAWTMMPHYARAADLINKLESEGKLGPVFGRWQDFMAGKWGQADDDYRRLQVDLSFITTGLNQIHGGARGGASPYMADKVKQFINTSPESASNMLASLDEMKQWIDGYAAMAPGENRNPQGTQGGAGAGTGAAGVGAGAGAGGAATHHFDPATGKIVAGPPP